jgi:hypothetical protein
MKISIQTIHVWVIIYCFVKIIHIRMIIVALFPGSPPPLYSLCAILCTWNFMNKKFRVHKIARKEQRGGGEPGNEAMIIV